MKTRTFLLAVAMMCGTQYMTAQTESQPSEPQRPTKEQTIEMMAKRAAYDLMLDEATTAKFVPVYENYLKAMDELRAKGQDGKQCCAMRPDGPKDAPRPGDRRGGKKGGKRDGKREGNIGPKPEGEKAPAQQAQQAQQAPEAKACPSEGCAQKSMTDAEVEQAMKDRFARLREEADIQEKYYNELRSVLTPLQVARVMNFGPREPQGPQQPREPRGPQGPRV